MGNDLLEFTLVDTHLFDFSMQFSKIAQKFISVAQ